MAIDLLKYMIWKNSTGGGSASYEKTVGPAPIISISDAKAKPAKSLIVGMEPIQDLHGYDSPWPAGGGTNKLDTDSVVVQNAYGFTVSKDADGFFNIVGTYNGSASNPSYAIATKGSVPFDENMKFLAFDKNADAESCIAQLRFTDSGGGIAVDSKAVMVNGQSYNMRFRIVECSKSETPTAWTPYENLCPISGRTGVTVERTGANLFDKSISHHNVPNLWIGSEDNNGTPDGSLTVSAGTYTISASESMTGIYVYDANARINVAYNNTKLSFTISETKAIRIVFYKSGMPDWDNINFMLNLGSTSSPYEPYVGASYPVTWQTEAGTVYSGAVDVVTGVLTVTHGIVDLGTLNWKMVGVYAINRFDANVPLMTKSNASPYYEGIFCSAYKPSNIPIMQANVNATIARYGGRVYVCDSAYSDADSFKNGVSGVEFCYELATPITYQLTPTQIQMLKGSNTLWADADDLTLTYLAKKE